MRYQKNKIAPSKHIFTSPLHRYDIFVDEHYISSWIGATNLQGLQEMFTGGVADTCAAENQYIKKQA